VLKNDSLISGDECVSKQEATTWKLHELLKRWVSAKKWSMGLDELRLLLGVAGRYPRWDNLKNKLYATTSL